MRLARAIGIGDGERMEDRVDGLVLLDSEGGGIDRGRSFVHVEYANGFRKGVAARFNLLASGPVTHSD